MKSDQEIRDAFTFAQQEQIQWYRLYEACYKFAMPQRNNYWQMTSGQKKDMYLYDSTTVLAVKSFVAKTQAAITPPGVNWCNLKSGYAVPDDQREDFDKLLQNVTNIFFDHLRKSNFDLSSAESYYDLSVGTAALNIRDTPDLASGFWFDSVSQYLISAFENCYGVLTNVFRHYRFIRKYQIKHVFPYVTFPADLEKSIKDDPMGLYPMVDAWLDNEDGTFTNVVGDETLSGEFYYRSDKEKSSPWVVYRWAKLPGENYGRGPTLDIMGDVKTANSLMERMIKQADLVVNPPLGYYQDAINPNNIIIQPGAVIPLKPIGLGAGIKPLEPLFQPGDIQLGEWIFNKLWDNINKAHYAQPLGQMTDPTKTATEMEYRMQMYSEEVGPSIGRMESEYLDRVIKRGMYILNRQGKLPKNSYPDDIYSTLSYESPLIENQKMNELRSVERFAQIIAQLGGPDATAQVIDIPAAVTKLAELTNVPLEIVKSQVQLAQDQQQKQQMQAAQQKMQQLQFMQQMQNGQGGNGASPNVPQGPSVLPGGMNAQQG